MRSFCRSLRIISAVTLFFFVWSFLPLYSLVAYAAEPARMRNADSGMRNGKPEPATVGDRFEKALEAIRENVDRLEKKHALSGVEGAVKGEDDTRERDVIKAKRAEIESADGEFKKEFSATEKKLKDAKLPKEILDRHYKFVKHYEDNLKELRANLSAVEQYKADGKQGKESLKKAKAHLEKVKAPSKHQKLDPNNLPFRARKAGKTLGPRLKQEEFERDFPSRKKTRTAFNLQDRLAADSRRSTQIIDSGFKSALYRKPILVASNGSLAGLLSSDNQLPLPSGERTEVRGGLIPNSAFAIPNWDTSIADSSPLLLAQATVQPSADDLAETPDVQFTDAIRVKAQELGGKPLKIYEWVRNNIEYAPTYGSIQGADQCLQSKICNDMDTASLLIALLRVSGVYSHYEYSTIEIPIEKAMNWVGGVTDPKMAGTILATNGIPAKMLISGGTYKAVQLEHVYVKAWIDYIPSRGAVHKQGDMWIPLDASFKQYSYTQGINIQAAVPFNAQSFANQILSTATTNTTDGSVTNVNSAHVQQTMQDYQTQVQNYIQQNYPNATVGDVIGKKEIIKEDFPFLPGTLPYKTIQFGSEFAKTPDNLLTTMSFNIPDPTGVSAGLSYTTSLPQTAGKKITLSYDPATTIDVNLLNTYGGDITKVPPYLLNLRPAIKIDGNTVATGPQMQLGLSHDFVVTFYEPGIGDDRVQNVLDAGGYNAIVLEPQKYSYYTYEKNVLKFKNTLETMKAQLANGEQPSVERDNLIGDWLWLQGLYYFYAQGKMLGIAEWFNGVTVSKGVSMAITSAVPSVSHIFSIPTHFDLNGYGIDVDRNIFTVCSKISDQEKIKQFMKMAGYISSTLEHKHVEALSKTPAISTISLLNAANKAGIPIYTITEDNVITVLPKLQVSSYVIDDIRNAVGAGKVVTVQAREVSYYGTMGVGYIIQDPSTGAGAYKISGGANGGFQALLYCLKDILLTLGGMPQAESITTPTGNIITALLNWAQYGLDNAFSMNTSSNADSFVGAYLGLILLSLIATMVVVALVLSGAIVLALIAGIVAGIAFNYATMYLNSQQNGTPMPPFWCALPCGPVLVDAYQYWFTDTFNTFVNPCY